MCSALCQKWKDPPRCSTQANYATQQLPKNQPRSASVTDLKYVLGRNQERLGHFLRDLSAEKGNGFIS